MHALRILAIMAAILLLAAGCEGGTSQPNRPTPGVLELPWTNAQGFILRGEVRQVTQAHSLRVTLVLKDGRTIQTTEPVIDEVLRVIQRCGERCADTIVATE